MFIIFQLFILVFVEISILSIIKSKGLGLLFSLLFSSIMMTQITSIMLGGSLVDFKFYLHCSYVDLQLIKYYPIHTRNTIIGFIFISAFFYFLNRTLIKFDIKHKNSLVIISCIALSSLFFLPKGIASNLMEITSVLRAKEVEFDDALKSFNIKPNKYIKPSNVEAIKGKNIIIISLESMEKGYLVDSAFINVVPHLRQLSKEWTFYNMPMLPGSDWTAGSLYTLISGVPCLFLNADDQVLQSSRKTHVTGISHVLKSADYNMTYILGNPNFAGMGDILRTYGINFKAEKDFDENYPTNMWGIYDQDLFKEAKKELKSLAKQAKPFALFLSTINTHSPDGILDERLIQKIPKQKSNIELMAKALDNELLDFISFIKTENLMENTAIYILPDHLLMGTTPRVLNDFSEPRSLYLLTNVNDQITSYPKNQNIYQIDLPKLILEGAEIKHNATFLTDYLSERKNIPDFISNHRTQITEFNEAALKRVKKLAEED